MVKAGSYLKDIPKEVLYWFIASVSLVIAAFFVFSRSLLSGMVVVIWVLSAFAVVYIAKSRKGEKALVGNQRYLYAGIGVFMALFSFINCIIAPLSFWNPPFSIQEFTVLLSGISVVYFSLSGRRNVLLACAFPFIILFAAQVYDTYQSIVDVVSAPLLAPATDLSVFVLNLIGIKTNVAPGYIIQMLEPDGSHRVIDGKWMQVQIVSDCSGIWSLSAFTASLLIVSLAFKDLFARKNWSFIALGYIGTYAANILRIVVICLSVYYTGYGDFTHSAHLHAGWIAFSGWMTLFWYLFFSKRLLKRKS